MMICFRIMKQYILAIHSIFFPLVIVLTIFLYIAIFLTAYLYSNDYFTARKRDVNSLWVIKASGHPGLCGPFCCIFVFVCYPSPPPPLSQGVLLG